MAKKVEGNSFVPKNAKDIKHIYLLRMIPYLVY